MSVLIWRNPFSNQSKIPKKTNSKPCDKCGLCTKTKTSKCYVDYFDEYGRYKYTEVYYKKNTICHRQYEYF